ncbi:MAG: ISL3 family transposase, partial [Endozoicomonadaceae bacterium]|nr:ISL3 family transposase [Endozoicomonadaceae bacterium]
MDGNQVLMLGLAIEAPWKLVNQHLELSSSPNELVLEIEAERGSLYPCPT